MTEHRLTPDELRAFKIQGTDENHKIGGIVSRFIERAGPGFVLDVGAGLGDIAEAAFPDHHAILVDILDFEASQVLHHRRHCGDFFDFDLPAGVTCDIMVMSHVLQYIDDDVDRLNSKVLTIAPRWLITVVDQLDDFQAAAFEWFRENGIRANPELDLAGFPPAEFEELAREEFAGIVEAPDFARLSHQLGRIVFDAPMDRAQLASFAKWLKSRLPQPKLEIPQRVILYRRSHAPV